MQRTNLLRGSNARAYMNYLKKIGVPFEMFISNYQVHFKTELFDKKFVHSMQGNRVFACYAKIKKDVKTKPIPDINREQLSYFVHDFKADRYVGDVINIDLKSAYATILYRDGYITRDTFDYISKGTKQDRLVSVGMLASRKQHFKFDGGKIVFNDEIISEFSNFFFYAVKRTSEIMADLKTICGSRYLFTWVDGIYMLPDPDTVKQCEDYVEQCGFKYTTEQLREFEVKIEQKQVRVHFLKLSKGEWKPKPFTLPLVNSEFKRLMIEAILSKHKTKSK